MMPNRRFAASRSAILLSLIAMVSACTPGRIDYVHTESAYDAQQDRMIPFSRSLNADVTGNPFNIPQDDFNRVVNQAIQPAGYQPSPNGARVRFIFNGAPTNGDYMCGAGGDHGAMTGHSTGGTITVSAAYCRGLDDMTFLQASVSDISGPDDPRLKEFLRHLTVQLFPLPEPNQGFCMAVFC